MKKDDDEFKAKMQEMGWREIPREKRPKVPRGLTLKDCKSRITIFIDADIIEHFKQLSEESGKGYQTLINQTLREAIETEKSILSEVKSDLLKDKRFLENLKTALAI